MFRHVRLTSILALSIILVLSYCAKKPNKKDTILGYLPQKSDLVEWTEYGAPQIAEGEDLTLLINGGAEIYFEYGFKKAVFQSYALNEDNIINIEIYEMEDSASAYGMYTFKTGKNGQSQDFGTESLLENYYLNFWKGNFVVTLIGFDADPATQTTLIKFGKIIDSKIIESSQKPLILSCLPQNNLINSGITYLQGPMALFNQYEFSIENIFQLKEGVLADYTDYQIFIFNYKDDSDCLAIYENAKKHITNDPKFKEHQLWENGFSVMDSKNRTVTICNHHNFILINLGEDTRKAKSNLQKIKENLQ